MKLSYIPMLALVAGLLLLGSCSDPVSPGLPTYTGTNGAIFDTVTFVLPDNSVKTYQNLVADFGKSYFGFIDAAGIQRAVRLEDYTLERREITIMLPLPANANKPGEYVWVDGASPTTTEAYLTMERDDVPFVSVRGKTVITRYGAIGEKVEGTFSGTIRNLEDGVETDLNGRFSATRTN